MSADLEHLLTHASTVPPGADKVRALCAVADFLEADGQLERAFDFKLQIAHLADQAGMPERALEAFVWCRAVKREHPRRFATDIVPAFERLVHSLIGKVAWTELAPLLDDFEQATKETGASLYRVYWQRQVVAWFRGDEASADAFAERMRRECSPLGNCQLCDLNFEIRRIAERGDHEHALALAGPLLRGERSCSSVPRSTYEALLYPLLALGRKEEAERCYQKGYALLRSTRRHGPEFGLYLRYLALVEAWGEACEMLERHLGPSQAFVLDSYAFTFYQGAWIYCEKVRRKGQNYLPIRLERKLGLPRHSSGGVDLEVLTTFLHGELSRIAARYDANNASTRFADLLARDERLVTECYAPRARVDPRR